MEPNPALVPIAQELGTKISQFKAALTGTGVSPQRFIRVVMTAININPDLLRCERRSLMNAALKAASDGLVPDGQDGALVPFQGKVTWLPMIAGIRKKVRRSGEITSWDVTAVFSKDYFDYELGDDPFIKHKPWLPGPPPARAEGEEDAAYNKRLHQHISHGELTHVYSVARIKGGDLSRDVMTRAEIELIRDTYARKDSKGQFSPAWRRSFPEMAKKTVARRHAKSLPMSTDILALLSRDDELYDLNREPHGPRVEAPRDLSDRLDALVDDNSSDDGLGGEGETVDQGGPSSSPGPESSPTADATPSAPAKPPGTQPQPPSEAPGGAPAKRKAPKEPDLLAAVPLNERGLALAKKGSKPLEDWITAMPADDMARVSLAQMTEWRNIAKQAEGEAGADA